MSRLLVIFAFLGILRLVGAEPPRLCYICRDRLGASFCWLTNPVLPDRVPVCKDCSRITNICFSCGVPVKFSYRTLEKDESAVVRVSTSNVVVRCLEIRDESVVIQVSGSDAPTTLPLRKN